MAPTMVDAGVSGVPFAYLMPTDFQKKEQADFEVESTRLGVQRFHEALKDARDLTELAAGKRLLREIVPGLAARILEARQEAAQAIKGKGSATHPPPWAWPIDMLADDDEGEKMAVITLGTTLGMNRVEREDAGYTPTTTSIPVTPLARQISKGVRLQIEYDRWLGANPDIAKRLRRTYPDVHRNVWQNWRRKIDGLQKETWPVSTEIALGSHLAHLLVTAAPTRFSVEKITLQGKPTAHLTISDETVELISDITTRCEVARPFYLPMVCPPIPWRYE